MKDNKKEWRKKAREYLAVAFGGACTICGYNKTISALDYHHLDPKQKDSALSIAMRNGHAWSKIVLEARKCTLVCCRCHRELHAGVTGLPESYAKFNEEYVDVIKLKQREFDECPLCGNEKNKRLKFCSQQCSAQNQRVFEITKEELEKLIEEKSYEKIGEIYGVTGNAIKKRCKTLGIDLKSRRGHWTARRDLTVNKEELYDLLTKKSVTAIARLFKTNNIVVKRKIKEFELEVPEINWKKEARRLR